VVMKVNWLAKMCLGSRRDGQSSYLETAVKAMKIMFFVARAAI